MKGKITITVEVEGTKAEIDSVAERFKKGIQQTSKSIPFRMNINQPKYTLRK